MSDITVNNFKAFYEQIRPYLGAVHSGFTPIGTVISVMGTTAPLNYLACDGTVYNISDYPELAAYFNQQFGASNNFGGNGTTTFAVPDLRGEFLRGTGTNSHANQGSGAAVGVHQDGTAIPQDINITGSVVTAYIDTIPPNEDYVLSSTNVRNAIDKNISYNNGRIVTSRPTNTSVLYCIASKNIFMDAGSNYSTEEQVVGTWFDGKPIYQITITNEVSTTSNPSMFVPTSVFGSVGKKIRNITGIFYNSDGDTPHGAGNNYFTQGNGGIMYVYTKYNNGATGLCTVLYTKTTD